MALLALAAALLLPATSFAQSAGEVANRRCLVCHGRPDLATQSPAERRLMVAALPAGVPAAPNPAARPGLVVLPEDLLQSVHASLRCIDCHTTAEQLPHPAVLPAVNCTDACHAPSKAEFDRSVHAQALAAGDPQAPDCTHCHGSHTIVPPWDRRSRTHPLNVISACGDCHEQHTTRNAKGESGHESVHAYLESVHGRGVRGAGLAVSATCADCHHHHEILPASSPTATTSRARVPETCGTCHLGVVEVYAESIHGLRLEEGHPLAPVCTDCHTAHSITRADTPAFTVDIVNECGECHDRPELAPGRRATFYRTYRESYHGQVNRLGSSRAASCSDCHGAHDIQPLDHPDSRLYGENLIRTCASCHPRANANFVMFDPHADYRDRERYPLLYAVWWYFIIVISSAFGFFGIHTICWAVRSIRERMKNGPPAKHAHGGPRIRRFSRLDRINHGFLIISFFGLTVTGLPLRFSDQPWAHVMAKWGGGVEALGLWHRFFAIMLMGNFILHFYGLWKSFRARRSTARQWLFGPTSMMPRVKDLTDFRNMVRWFVRGGKKPTFDRWTYWEKFDYWAEIGGSVIIGGSGLLLWFPEFFSTFLPGWIFNVAMVVHGYEALLAIGFIFTIHFFNAHLRLEKFPVDSVIFTGQLPEEEFIHERGEEYERLRQQGRLDELKVPPAPRWLERLAVVIGFVAMSIGTTLVVLIILAGLRLL